MEEFGLTCRLPLLLNGISLPIAGIAAADPKEKRSDSCRSERRLHRPDGRWHEKRRI